MKITCPNCQGLLPATQLNVATDVAVCLHCDEAFALSSVVAAGGEADDDFNLLDPPRGAWFEHTATGWQIGASTRSYAAWFLVPFMCVWSGFSLGGIYGSQIASGEFDLFMSLFGIPFVLGTLLFGSIALMTVCGKVVVSVDRTLGAVDRLDGRVFTGVGPIGWRRRFDWTATSAVEESWAHQRYSGDNGGLLIALVGPKNIKLASMVSQQRRDYLLRGLRTLLRQRQETLSHAGRMVGQRGGRGSGR